MVVLFNGIAPPSQFPATIASGAPPGPNHACFQGRVDVCFETRWRSKGGRRGACLHRAHYAFPKKKKSLRALRAHNERTYITATSAFLGVPKDMGDKIRIGGAHKWAEMLHHPCILGDPQRKGDKIRIGCLTLAFWETHKWAEMLHHPCILGDPQQTGQSQSKKKAKKTNKNFPMVSLVLPTILQIDPTGA